jgi:3-carboxy-cis,cis-muconate cycloisomerase
MPVNPADSPVFGTMYGSDPMRAVFDDNALFARMLEVEAALARVQARLGIIPQDAADAISAASRPEILRQDDLEAAARNIGYPVSGVVKSLTRAAGEPGRWTHWGATTQDIVDTAQVLQIREGLALIRTELRALVDALAAQADRHRHAVMAARSYMQQALPTTFGLKCATWLMPLIDHVHRLDQLRPRVERVEFGGAGGTLASLGDQGLAVMESLAAELDLAAPPAPWHVARDAFAETVSYLGLLCGSLAKMANDIILLAQTEVGEVAEPHIPGRGGSSTLPHKRNPIASAYVLAAQRGVQALVPLMQSAMLDQHERGAGPWQAELLALPQSFVLTHGALVHARLLAEGMVPDPARMRRNLDITQGAVVAEAVAMGLAPILGREQAHEAVKHASDRALKEGGGLTKALLQDPAITAHLDPPAIHRLTDPANYLGATQPFIDRVLAQTRTV